MIQILWIIWYDQSNSNHVSRISWSVHYLWVISHTYGPYDMGVLIMADLYGETYSKFKIYFSMVQAHGTERYNCDTLEDLTRKFIPNEKQNFSCWIRIKQDKGRDIKPRLINIIQSLVRSSHFRIFCEWRSQKYTNNIDLG